MKPPLLKRQRTLRPALLLGVGEDHRLGARESKCAGVLLVGSKHGA